MLRSLFSGVTGLKAHSVKMDVIGNNISNVNTIGFKRQTTEFKTLVSQMIRGASPATGSQGSRNPMQVGLGVEIGAINTDFKPGSTKGTGKETDLAINGDGFFVVEGLGEHYYTRAGNFDLDADGFLVSGDRLRVLGWKADALGNVNTAADVEALQFRLGETKVDARATDEVMLGKNLDAETSIGDTITVDTMVYDSLGIVRPLTILLTKTADNQWDWTASIDGVAGGAGTIDFDASGNISGGNTGTVNVAVSGGAAPMNVTLNFDQLTQTARDTTVSVVEQNGYETGFLQEISIASNGDIFGIFDNAVAKRLATLAIATFSNPGGLLQQAGTAFSQTLASGQANITTAENEGAGSVISSALEMSNVDLSEEFVEMIVAQRGFQANSRVITTGDQIIEEVLSLKRR